MSNITQSPSHFVLTRKNQKGQVAIFVALIFQVVFVFFALLINVGLLVHHKINLQQSTDLAAYYGAMKQAEGLNTIAHVNFQIKQAWKLLTWRYRILGTFGFRAGDSDPGPPIGTGLGSQRYPFEAEGSDAIAKFVYNGSAGTSDSAHPNGMKCDLGGPTPLGIQDIPFFCVGHPGFANWPQSESNCQLNCRGFAGAREIGLVNTTGLPADMEGINFAGTLRNTLIGLNANITEKCNKLGPIGAAMLTRFILAYVMETQPRLRTIEALAANLSLEADKVLDIEGNTIQSGSLLTFKNNLTEANLASLQASDFKIENGLANDKCKFRDGLTGQEFLKKIEFQFINYFIHSCSIGGAGGNPQYKPENVFKPTGGLGDSFLPNPAIGREGISANERAILESLSVAGQQHTIGFEKNPHCVEYYAVKASTTPQIPFLPLTKIKLNAVAIAKPFGGNIGPWYFKTWPKGNVQSQGDQNIASTKIDPNLPLKNLSISTAPPLTQSLETQPNFSLYIGDEKGLRDSDYIAAYHSALAIRDINTYNGKSYAGNRNTAPQLANPAPERWPALSNWDGIVNTAIGDFRDYDTLATDENDKAGMRALEITAIAPNQFDITHYSIDPDFYNNYYKKLYNTGLAKILAATGKSGTMTLNQLRADFGAAGMRADQPSQPTPLDVKSFSVKDQILLKNTILNTAPTITDSMSAPNTGKTYAKILNHLVSLQSSLLTSWTFQSFSDYDKFPSDPVDSASNSMSFGQCSNAWNNTAAAITSPLSEDNFKTPMDIDAKFPPTPGNCVTGGRTGYSVKIVSPSVVRDNNNLENPLEDSFFNF